MLTLDPNLSDAEKTKLVNDRIAEIAREHPSCKITTEYARTPPLEETPTGEVYHLLWSSDRLEIARGSGFPDYKNICRPRVAGKDDAL